MKNKDETHCNICARSPQDHVDMDHPFKTLASLRAEYDAAAVQKDEAEIRLQRIADGRDARKDLRNDVKLLLDAHYRAGTNTGGAMMEAETDFDHLLDDIRESLDTLEETIGI